MAKSDVPGYGCWRSMHKRCSQPSHDKFSGYGGRGISVCARWSSFEKFIEDMGPRPSSSHSIERDDVNGNYEPGNCRWATRKEQARNIRVNVKVTVDGREVLLIDECEVRGIPYQTAYMRLRRGMTAEQALSPHHFPKGPWRGEAAGALNKAGLKGVSPKRGKWRATITINRKQHWLGTFDTPEEAHSAYLKANEERISALHKAASVRRKEKTT